MAIWYVVTHRYISTSPKRKLRNNTDVIDYTLLSRPKSAAKDIDIADILGKKCLYRIDIGKTISTHL